MNSAKTTNVFGHKTNNGVLDTQIYLIPKLQFGNAVGYNPVSQTGPHGGLGHRRSPPLHLGEGVGGEVINQSIH